MTTCNAATGELDVAPSREIVAGDLIPATKVELPTEIDWTGSTFTITKPASLAGLVFNIDTAHALDEEGPYLLITSTSPTENLPQFWHFNLKETGRYNRALGRWPFQVIPV